MRQEDAQIVDHVEISGGYRKLVMKVPSISSEVKAGQFIHMRVPGMKESVLRRPFSIFQADEQYLAILYKNVGRGTDMMVHLAPGDTVDILGPCGNGYPDANAASTPLLVAGGYGMAALYLVAKSCPKPGVAFFGGRTAGDILCVEDFEALGWTVLVTTEDGSLGQHGIVTTALNEWLSAHREPVEYFVCGPNPMLQAIGQIARQSAANAWLSVDCHMGCGVGACLTCVQKIRKDEGWEWARACREGPVFECRDIIWKD